MHAIERHWKWYGPSRPLSMASFKALEPRLVRDFGVEELLPIHSLFHFGLFACRVGGNGVCRLLCHCVRRSRRQTVTESSSFWADFWHPRST